MNILQESNGDYSLRRTLALIFCLLSCVAGVYSVLNGVDWKLAAVAFGAPIIADLVLVFFTTWESVATIIKAVKGDKE